MRVRALERTEWIYNNGRNLGFCVQRAIGALRVCEQERPPRRTGVLNFVCNHALMRKPAANMLVNGCSCFCDVWVVCFEDSAKPRNEELLRVAFATCAPTKTLDRFVVAGQYQHRGDIAMRHFE